MTADRYWLILLSLIAVTLFHLGIANAEGQRSTSGRPNVLLIVSEDNSPNLGCYGDVYAKTPNLDRLAAEGVRFEHAFVTTASCSESRSSMLTGLFPHQNGQIGLATHGYCMFGHQANVASLLKSNGYRTGIIGKLHVNPAKAFPFDFQWNDQRYCSFSHRDVRKIAEIAGQFMTASKQPFFLMVNYPDAHLPWLAQQKGVPDKPLAAGEVPPPAWVGLDTPALRQGAADYYNCIQRLDTAVGLLLAKLAETGQAKRTLVIYLADHGAQFPRGKLTCYESGLAVPLIVSWPGKARTGSVRDELVSTVDLLPTILEATGLKNPGGLPGRSLVPLLKNESVAWREYLFAEYHSHYPPLYFPQRTVRDGRYKLIVSLLQDRPDPTREVYLSPNTRWSIVREAELGAAPSNVRRAYETWHDAPPNQLYDLQNDPCELNNLANRPEWDAVLERLRRQLTQWQHRTDDPLTDPDKLARLTKEEDTAAAGYEADRHFRSSHWLYPRYLRAVQKDQSGPP